MNSLRIAKLSAGTVYKLMLVGLLCGFLPLFMLFGILGWLDLMTLSWNAQPVTGPKAIVAAPFMGVFFALVCTALIGSVAALGLWIYARFRTLTIEFVPAGEAGRTE